jgi:hypothetical protein
MGYLELFSDSTFTYYKIDSGLPEVEERKRRKERGFRFVDWID